MHISTHSRLTVTVRLQDGYWYNLTRVQTIIDPATGLSTNSTTSFASSPGASAAAALVMGVSVSFDVGGNTWVLTVAPTSGFVPGWSGLAFAASVAGSAVIAAIIGCSLRVGRQGSPEHVSDGDTDELCVAVQRLRDRLRLRPVDGFIVGDEAAVETRPMAARLAKLLPCLVAPAQRVRRLVALRALDVEAAALLSLWRDFDVRRFDALCACIQGDYYECWFGGEAEAGGRDYRGTARGDVTSATLPVDLRTRTWLVELSGRLLDPQLSCECRTGSISTLGMTKSKPPIMTQNFQDDSAHSLRLPGILSHGYAGAGSRVEPVNDGGGELYRLASAENGACHGGAANPNCRCEFRLRPTAHMRFEYFREYVGKVALWQVFSLTCKLFLRFFKSN